MSKQTNKSLPANSTQIKKDGQTPAWLPIRTLSLLLAIISFAVYANTMQNGYVLDDATVITRNTIVTKGFSGIPEILVTPRLKGFEQSNDAGSYRPVPLILSAIEYQLFGANPSEGHLSNVLLFIGCVIALFLFLNRLLKNERTGIAFIAALLFALHPVHTEVVANIKSRDELMCFLFAFISLICFTRYARSGKIMQLLAGAGALLLSYLSKETVIAFIFLIPLVFFFYENENRKRSLFITASTAVITIGFLLVRAAVLGTNHTNAIVFLSNPLISAPDLLSRMASAILVIGMYLKLLFLPYPLICDYSYNSIPTVGFGNLFVLVSLAVILALTVTGIYRLVRRPKDPWAFGILFFLATLK